MNTEAQPIKLARRWESPIVRTFFIGIMTLLGLLCTAGRAFWATTLAPNQPPLPLWANFFLYGLGLLFIGLWMRSALIAFRDVRTQFTSRGLARPKWLRRQYIVWSDITNVTITSMSVALTTSSTVYDLAFESFRKPTLLLNLIQERVADMTPIADLRQS